MRRLLAALKRGYCTVCGRGFDGSSCPVCSSG